MSLIPNMWIYAGNSNHTFLLSDFFLTCNVYSIDELLWFFLGNFSTRVCIHLGLCGWRRSSPGIWPCTCRLRFFNMCRTYAGSFLPCSCRLSKRVCPLGAPGYFRHSIHPLPPARNSYVLRSSFSHLFEDHIQYHGHVKHSFITFVDDMKPPTCTTLRLKRGNGFVTLPLPLGTR